MLRFGKESLALRDNVAVFAAWLANDTVPWPAYRALMANRLVALDKCPGVRLVGIGEAWRRLLAKCVIAIAGREAKVACGTAQLCAGLEAGIEGAAHAIDTLWRQHEDDEEWGFLLVDARNAFNEGNRHAFLWTIRPRWPSGARFTFNCYKHWSMLILRNPDGQDCEALHSREGVTQGDPLSMIS